MTAGAHQFDPRSGACALDDVVVQSSSAVSSTDLPRLSKSAVESINDDDADRIDFLRSPLLDGVGNGEDPAPLWSERNPTASRKKRMILEDVLNRKKEIDKNAALASDPPDVVKEKAKKAKAEKKNLLDVLKVDMAAERTFFKWLWTGLQTGAIGTFIFVTFAKESSNVYLISAIGFAWLIAFAIVFFGLWSFSRRRSAMRNETMNEMPVFLLEYSPYIVSIAVGLVIAFAMLYVIVSGDSPRKD
jgi:uncharacterized membrane protein YidH (DUF202 family)